jgi:acetate kinase
MLILIFNCGSSSLKFELFEFVQPTGARERTLARGEYEDIGRPNAKRTLIAESGGKSVSDWNGNDHPTAAIDVLAWLESTMGSLALAAVAHRIVHGGDHVREPTLADAAVIRALEEASRFAPLHNPPALATLRAVSAKMPSVASVVVTDTAFHATMPAYARAYALPRDLTEKHGIRRFGFHGIGHAYMLERYAELTGAAVDRLNLVTMQLGAGCSMAAIRNGRSIDTSMGLTPLEGLVMATRCGDIDPAIFSYLARNEAMTPDEIEQMLNHRSGLLGLSGISEDMRDVLAAAKSDPDGAAALAVAVFVHRARKYLGAYFAVLGRVDGIVFAGGIGEHAAEIRMRICAGLEAFGIKLDPQANIEAKGREALISSPDASVKTYVIPLDEERYIARAAVRLIARG